MRRENPVRQRERRRRRRPALLEAAPTPGFFRAAATLPAPVFVRCARLRRRRCATSARRCAADWERRGPHRTPGGGTGAAVKAPLSLGETVGDVAVRGVMKVEPRHRDGEVAALFLLPLSWLGRRCRADGAREGKQSENGAQVRIGRRGARGEGCEGAATVLRGGLFFPSRRCRRGGPVHRRIQPRKKVWAGTFVGVAVDFAKARAISSESSFFVVPPTGMRPAARFTLSNSHVCRPSDKQAPSSPVCQAAVNGCICLSRVVGLLRPPDCRVVKLKRKVCECGVQLLPLQRSPGGNVFALMAAI